MNPEYSIVKDLMCARGVKQIKSTVYSLPKESRPSKINRDLGGGRVQAGRAARRKVGTRKQTTGDTPRRRSFLATRSIDRPEKTGNSEGDIDAKLEERFLRLKVKLQEYAKTNSSTHILESEERPTPKTNKGKRTKSRVSWADHNEGSLTSWCPVSGEALAAAAGPCYATSKEKHSTGIQYTLWKKSGLQQRMYQRRRHHIKKSSSDTFRNLSLRNSPTIHSHCTALTWWADASDAWQKTTEPESVENL